MKYSKSIPKSLLVDLLKKKGVLGPDPTEVRLYVHGLTGGVTEITGILQVSFVGPEEQEEADVAEEGKSWRTLGK